MADCKKLFERAYIGKLGLKNRLVMAPMGVSVNFATGLIDERGLEYYCERAKGGMLASSQDGESSNRDR